MSMKNYLMTIAALCLAVVACGVSTYAADDVVDQDPSVAPSGTRTLDVPTRADGPAPPDTTLATLTLSPTHTVRFTESAEGNLEVYEDLNADRDRGTRSLSALDTSTTTLTDIHRYLAPKARVPEALVDADARAAQRVLGPAEAAPEEDALSIADTESRAASDSAVAWDWNADAQWFKQNYYTGGTAGYFAANTVWVHVTKKRYTNWYKASAFNQSFDSSARFRVDRSRKCGFLGTATCWDTKLNENVGNRYVRTYLGSGNKYRRAWLDCGGPDPRCGLAVRWILSGTSSPPTPPAACGGHNQWVCSSGARCQPGLAEVNGGCYACGARGQVCCKDWGPVPTPGGTSGKCVEGVCGYPGGFCQ
jgi:hypothetical protein